MRGCCRMSKVSAIALSSLLRTLVPLCAINQAKQTHLQILVRGLLHSLTLQTDLLLAYSRCGHLQYAHKVFDEMPQPSMHSWNILISSHVQNSLFEQSLGVFHWFLKLGFQPDHFTFPSLFKACAGIGGGWATCVGRSLHGWVVKVGFDGYVVLGCSILDFYAKCGELGDAHLVFVEMPMRDVVVWNSMISSLVRAGLLSEALGCYREMVREGVEVDSRTVSSLLNTCGRGGDLLKGKEIHGRIVKDVVFNEDVVIGNCLIDMYAKCGYLGDSKKVFENMSNLSLVTWTTLISCYGVHGKGEEALVLFDKMKDNGYRPNCVTLTAILASCSHSGLIDQGRKIFNSMTGDYGIQPSVEHYACLVDLLGRFGHLEEALGLTKTMPEKPGASVWGALLGACRMHKNVEIGEVAAYWLFELEAGNSSNYVALCSIYESLGRGDDILRIRRKMRELGLVKNPGCSWITVAGKVCTFYQGDTLDARTRMVYEALDRMIERMISPLDNG
ncbi:hypothetical protein Sjap_018486 [Stephania japonica]|uniref:Pentatricopeptide repeat-containing protein n=1 Tax=Stephania japonica TaxID=461633 RepID=A0AAP0NN86_9MAGN